MGIWSLRGAETWAAGQAAQLDEVDEGVVERVEAVLEQSPESSRCWRAGVPEGRREEGVPVRDG